MMLGLLHVCLLMLLVDSVHQPASFLASAAADVGGGDVVASFCCCCCISDRSQGQRLSELSAHKPRYIHHLITLSVNGFDLWPPLDLRPCYGLDRIQFARVSPCNMLGMAVGCLFTQGAVSPSLWSPVGSDFYSDSKTSLLQLTTAWASFNQSYTKNSPIWFKMGLSEDLLRPFR